MKPDADFEMAATEYLADLYYNEPVMATRMGVHEYDDRLPDRSKHANEARLRRARAFLHDIDHINLVGMSGAGRIDCRLARAATQSEIAEMEQLRPWERRPGLYVDEAMAGVYALLSRDFAEPDSRAEAAAARLEAVPALLAQGRSNLAAPVRLSVESAVAFAGGGCRYLRESLPALAGEVHSRALADRLLSAGRVASASLDEFARFLETEGQAAAVEDFAIGRELYDYLLRVGHLMEESGDDLLEIGRQAAEEARQHLAAVAAEMDASRSWEEVVTDLASEYPAAEGLLDAYRAELERARDFVVEKGLAGLPEDESLAVAETPAFARAFMPPASYSPPPPFEERQVGVFWVTPVNAASAEERAALRRGHSVHSLPVIAVHEAYPGHHLQLSRANRIESRFRRHFGGSALFSEGWALYCEEMMFEQGFYSSVGAWLMELRNQLWRACQVIIDVSIHRAEMTFQEAVTLLVREAKLAGPHARAEVLRSAMNPTQQMSYLLGKRAILEIRDLSRRRQRSDIELGRFHDDLLSHGSLPPLLLREAMGL